MQLLIDGYNLLHQSSSAVMLPTRERSGLHKARNHFLQQLALRLGLARRRMTTVVFDAKDAPRDLPSDLRLHDMHVLFARDHNSADEMIQQLIERHPTPRKLTVVSSDHAIQRKAAARGAQWIDSDQWLDELGSQSAYDVGATEPANLEDSDEARLRRGEISPHESRQWLNDFGFAPDELGGID